MTSVARNVKESQNAPSERALLINNDSLVYALRVYQAKKAEGEEGYDELTIEMNRYNNATTLDIDELPEAFLQILVSNSRIRLEKPVEKLIRARLPAGGDVKVRSITQFVAALNSTNANAREQHKPAFEAKIMGRWYPINLQRADDYNTFFGHMAYISINYKIGDQNEDRTLKFPESALVDRDDPVHVKTLSEVLSSIGLRLATDESIAAYREKMADLRRIVDKPGLVLEVTSSVLALNKFLFWDVLSEQELGSPDNPQLCLVEPELEAKNSSREDDDDDVNSESQAQLPFIRAFSLELKRYVYVDLADAREKVFAENALERLHLPEDMRDILTKVFTAKKVHGDMFRNRHGGMVVLAHGPSGVGKTLTAEVFAELTKRPLYVLEMGELGTNLDKVEESLQRVFARAARWNAVLLFDEADIFLAKRNETELERSAIVGVFLRLLDQYKGMFFLTTNRADVMDPAIAGRITLRLNYPEIDDQFRAKIWTDMLASAGFTATPEVIEQVAKAQPINGRQVRNQVRLLKILYPEQTELNLEQASRCLQYIA